MSSHRWVRGKDYPNWAESDVYKKTIAGGYLINDETPKDAYWRVANTVAAHLERPETVSYTHLTLPTICSV